jgi:hypothetical protein
MSTKLPVVKDLIEHEEKRRKAETHVKLKRRHVKITRRSKGFSRHLNNSCYESHPVFMYKTCQGFPIFLSALIACTDTLPIKLPLSYSSRPSRVRLPEPPTALKLRYVSWTCTHSFTSFGAQPHPARRPKAARTSRDWAFH